MTSPLPLTNDEADTWCHAYDVATTVIVDIQNRIRDREDERKDALRIHDGVTLEGFLQRSISSIEIPTARVAPEETASPARPAVADSSSRAIGEAMSDFDFDDESTVFHGYQSVAVYKNEYGDIVVRQRVGGGEEDSFVIIPRIGVSAVVRAIRAAARGE